MKETKNLPATCNARAMTGDPPIQWEIVSDHFDRLVHLKKIDAGILHDQ
ncbi:MAG: hypothetical protein JW774_02535 [Candidatus Aureabacteria bacterium]|nr:hypothetical protein [Candidatus Auribacterota bacterium]